MSPARLSGNGRDEIEQKLIHEMESAEESYRSTQEEYLRVSQQGPTTDDPQATHTIYAAAKRTRMARKRYRRAKRVLTGFTTS